MHSREGQGKRFIRSIIRSGLKPMRVFLGLCCLLGASVSASPYAGTYAGSYTGADSGAWRFTVGGTGQITGWADGSALMGKVNESGGITMGFVSSGESFTGKIDANGNVSGTWKDSSSPGYNGTFWGKRTSQPAGGGGAQSNGGVYAGVYGGTYDGSESGNWKITVDASGVITGTAGGYAVSGQVSATGRIDMGMVSSGERFVGQISANGRVTGTWEEPYSNWGGTFQGEKNGSSVAETAGKGSYDGHLLSTEMTGSQYGTGAVRGLLSLKVSSGKLTAKATLQSGSVSLSAGGWSSSENGTYRALLSARGGEELELFMQGVRVWGVLSGGVLGNGRLVLEGARNRFAENDATANALIEGVAGYYTVALPLALAYVSIPEDWSGVPLGSGYLTLTVGAKGAVKVAGVLGDGTKVSTSSRLVLREGSRPEAHVPFFVPLYMRKGWIGGLLRIDVLARTLASDCDSVQYVLWEKPGRGADGILEQLDACGGFYGTGASLASAYLFGAETEGTVYFDALGEPRDWSVLPETVPVTAAGASLSVAKGAKPKKVSEEGDVSYEYDEVNPANVTLTFASRTGLFKGKFNLYCDYEDATGKVVHKAVSVPYAGVLAPVRGGAFDGLPAGLGHCLIPDSDPAVKPYRLKRSRPVWLEGQ